MSARVLTRFFRNATVLTAVSIPKEKYASGATYTLVSHLCAVETLTQNVFLVN